MPGMRLIRWITQPKAHDGSHWPLAPFLGIVLGLAAGILLSVAYTSWAINHSYRQACTEYRILATTDGAITPYDQAVKTAYGQLYQLRCR